MTSAEQKTPTGRSWQAMMTRCFNKNDRNFIFYGAKGITACDFIKQSFRSIIGLIGERPFGKTLDRINNDGNYSCGSCLQCKQWGWIMNIRWATIHQQARNKSNNHLVTINGITKCASDWEQSRGLKNGTIVKRLKRGWLGEKLLSPPTDWNRYITILGETKRLKEWSSQLGINSRTLAKRINKGWKDSELLLGKQKPRQVYKFYAHN